MDAVALLIIAVGATGFLLLKRSQTWREVFVAVIGFGAGMLAGGIWAMAAVAGALR